MIDVSDENIYKQSNGIICSFDDMINSFCHPTKCNLAYMDKDILNIKFYANNTIIRFTLTYFGKICIYFPVNYYYELTKNGINIYDKFDELKRENEYLTNKIKEFDISSDTLK